MTEAAGSFAGSRGRRIFWHAWTPGGVVRGVVVLVHGAGEHSGRYGHVVSRLVAEGYAVHALDHRGHGRSDGPRAFIEDLDHAVADVDTLVDRAAAAQPGLPVFMLGHSLGVLISVRYALAHQERLAGLILSGALAAIYPVPRALELVGRAASVLAPRAPLIAIDASLVSRDPAVVEAYRADPLVHHGKLPARTAAQIADAVASLPETVGAITVPALILYGTADGLCPPAGSEMLAQRIGSAELTVKAYEGLFHEILNEPERDAVLDDIVAWLTARVRPGDPDAVGSSRS
ncbi:MAG TPA: alpha/beta hydrolase [Solirubrobacteraceae bacterium]|nr:alpha/beta hydrolase [Solirubrobacteraceae bacterium]